MSSSLFSALSLSSSLFSALPFLCLCANLDVDQPTPILGQWALQHRPEHRAPGSIFNIWYLIFNIWGQKTIWIKNQMGIAAAKITTTTTQIFEVRRHLNQEPSGNSSGKNNNNNHTKTAHIWYSWKKSVTAAYFWSYTKEKLHIKCKKHSTAVKKTI